MHNFAFMMSIFYFFYFKYILSVVIDYFLECGVAIFTFSMF